MNKNQRRVYHWSLICGIKLELAVIDFGDFFMFSTMKEDESKLTKYGDKRRQFQKINIPKTKMKYLIKFLEARQ